MSFDRFAARLRNAIGRALLALVDDAKGLQTVQVETRADVVRDRAERFQNYGLTSVPLPGAEAVALAVGGSTDHTIVIAVDDRRYRMKGLAAGEVALYDDQGQSVHLTRAGIVVKGAGKPIKFTDTSLVEIDADLQVNKGIKAKLDIVDQSGAGGKSMAAMRATYNVHTHPETNITTGAPSQSM